MASGNDACNGDEVLRSSHFSIEVFCLVVLEIMVADLGNDHMLSIRSFIVVCEGCKLPGPSGCTVYLNLSICIPFQIPVLLAIVTHGWSADGIFCHAQGATSIAIFMGASAGVHQAKVMTQFMHEKTELDTIFVIVKRCEMVKESAGGEGFAFKSRCGGQAEDDVVKTGRQILSIDSFDRGIQLGCIGFETGGSEIQGNRHVNDTIVGPSIICWNIRKFSEGAGLSLRYNVASLIS